MIRSLKSFDIRGQTILMRLDLNVPINRDKIIDDFRIRSCIPTINFCLEEGASIVIMRSGLIFIILFTVSFINDNNSGTLGSTSINPIKDIFSMENNGFSPNSRRFLPPIP